MIRYYFNEDNPFDTALQVDFGSKEDAWLENMLADMHAMLNAVINVTVTKYVHNDEEQEAAVGVIKSFIIDDLIESDTDLEGFREMVLGYKSLGRTFPAIPQFNIDEEDDSYE